MSSAWALIEHHGEILMIRRALDRGRGGQWCLPGGTIWRNERPDVACVREAYEETSLRVTVVRPLAVFRGAHYFMCRLNTDTQPLRLRREEAIASSWISPQALLSLGTIMDLRRLVPLLELAGLAQPALPHPLEFAVPELRYDQDAGE